MKSLRSRSCPFCICFSLSSSKTIDGSSITSDQLRGEILSSKVKFSTFVIKLLFVDFSLPIPVRINSLTIALVFIDFPKSFTMLLIYVPLETVISNSTVSSFSDIKFTLNTVMFLLGISTSIFCLAYL